MSFVTWFNAFPWICCPWSSWLIIIAIHIILRNSLCGLCRLLVSRLFLVVELGILSWVENKGPFLIVMPPLVSTVLTLISLSILHVNVRLRVVEQVGIVPHVRVRVIVLELPSLLMNVAHFMLIL